MRILSGVQSSGKLHLGNYFGAIKQFEKFVFNFKTDSAPCHNVSDDLKAVEVWA